MRERSLTSRLRASGFAHPRRAESILEEPAFDGFPLPPVEAFAQAADPDMALLAIARLAGEWGRLAPGTAASLMIDGRMAPGLERRLLGVLGASSVLGDFLITHPEHLAVLALDEDLDTISLEAEHSGALVALGEDTGVDAVNALRRWYYSRILAIAAVDLTSEDPTAVMPAVSRAISHVVGGALEGALAIARSEVQASDDTALTVIAMGKTGALEVNYISDVDVVYVARSRSGERPEVEMIAEANQLASALARIVSGHSREPSLWTLDANLRPEGKDGPLVRTLESHRVYYQRWAKSWEFQALLKARPIAGDMELGRAYIDALWPLVWEVAGREGFVEDSRAMRRRVEDHVPARDADRQLKLGKGGLRDIEFTVQLLQLVHGRTDESLRIPGTLDAIARLREGGYVARMDADALDRDYRLLRTLEHRIQLRKLRRSHLVPTAEDDLRVLARSMRLPGVATAEELDKAWNRTRREVRGLHQEIYYRPLLPEAARLSPDDISLAEGPAKARLEAIGYRDAAGALRHINALTEGVSRGAAIQRQLLPVMLGWFAQGPEPDAGLLAFRVLSEEMGHTSWYLRSLRDGGAAAERLCLLLSTSRYVAREMPRLAESVSWLADTADLVPRTRPELERELDSMLSRRADAVEIARAGRYLRRRELLRTAIGQVLRVVESVDSRAAVSHAADIALEAGLRAAVVAACAKHGSEGLGRYLLVAMGRLGGEEMGYASDADIVFVYDPPPGVDGEIAARLATEIASQVTKLLGSLDVEPPLPVDADLRPEGRHGPLARSLDSYAEYLERWAETWELQALLRARPCAGDPELARQFIELIDRHRYPENLTSGQILEIRKMKARVETERMPRGVEPQRHVKLGRGGLADVEWTAQFLQLRYAGKHPALRTTSTIGALAAAADEGLISKEAAGRLAEAWQLASLMRDLNVLGTAKTNGSKIDVLAHEIGELSVIAALLGRDTSERHEVEEDYLRAARRARVDVENILFGKDDQ